jgi:hypothetical protein
MKKEIKRLDRLIADATKIPESLQDSHNEFGNSKARTSIINRAKAFTRAQYGEDSEFMLKLKRISFQPVGMTFNDGHYLNDDAWTKGRMALIALLEEIQIDFMERKMTGKNRWNPGLYWTILGFALPLVFTIGYYLGKAEFNKDANDCYDEKKTLERELKGLRAEMESVGKSAKNDSTYLPIPR